MRGVYAQANYYGYVRNIQVGKTALYTVLDPSKTNSADIELNCDQSGIGFTPIIGIDYKTGRWNFAAKYEFKTRLRMKNSAVNSFPSIGVIEQNGQLSGHLVDNLKARMQTVLQQQLIQQGMSEARAQAAAAATAQNVMSNPRVQATMAALKQKFDQGLQEATGEYADGKKPTYRASSPWAQATDPPTNGTSPQASITTSTSRQPPTTIRKRSSPEALSNTASAPNTMPAKP